MSLSRSVLWNAAGIVLPLVVGVVAMPRIVAGLGVERFGALSVIWLMIGYFSVFDLGLGRTLTKLVADRLGSGEVQEIPRLVSTTLVIVATSGAILGLLTASTAGWITRTILSASAGQVHDTTVALAWLAVSLPFVLLATALFGLLEAFQKFALISTVRLPIGILTFLLPLAILPFSQRLGTITAGLALVRIVTAFALLLLSYRVVPRLKGATFAFHRELISPLLTFGGWLTVSNIVGPVMTYFDRFFIAAMSGAAAVAYYTVPYDALTRLTVFPTAIQAVIFPAFATLRHQNESRLRSVFTKSAQATWLLMTPALIATILLGKEGLQLWMGAPFAEHSLRVAEILMVGVMINSMARIPFAFLQSSGYANWTAMTHLVELPFYLGALWWLVSAYGIGGAAFAWTARVAIDTLVFYALSARIQANLSNDIVNCLTLTAVTCVLGFLIGWGVDSLIVKSAIVLLVALSCGAALLWRLSDQLARPLARLRT